MGVCAGGGAVVLLGETWRSRRQTGECKQSCWFCESYVNVGVSYELFYAEKWQLSSTWGTLSHKEEIKEAVMNQKEGVMRGVGQALMSLPHNQCALTRGDVTT